MREQIPVVLGRPICGSCVGQPRKLTQVGKTAKTQSKGATAVPNEYQADKYTSPFARGSHRASWQQQGLLVWDDCKEFRTKNSKGRKVKDTGFFHTVCCFTNSIYSVQHTSKLLQITKYGQRIMLEAL